MSATMFQSGEPAAEAARPVDLDAQLAATFTAEVADRVTSLQSHLAGLASRPQDRAVIAALFRDTHTIKGTARMVGAREVVGLADQAEELLARLRESTGSADPGVVMALRDTVAAIGRRVGLPGGGPRLLPVDERETGDQMLRIPAQRLGDVVDLAIAAEWQGTLLGTRIDEQRSGAIERRHALERLRGALGDSISPSVRAALAALDEALATDLLSALESARRADSGRSTARALRQAALSLGRVPAARTLAGLAQLAGQVGAECHVQADLTLAADDADVDAQVADRLHSALAHLVVNAIDHGPGRGAQRRSRIAIRLRVRQSADELSWQVCDDGVGIDVPAVLAAARSRGLVVAEGELDERRLAEVLCHPAVTTLPAPTAVSGRGVGLDVVAATVRDLGGSIRVSSSTAGTSITIAVPRTAGRVSLATFRVGRERWAVPAVSVTGTVPVIAAAAGMVTADGEAVVDLAQMLGVTAPPPAVALAVTDGDSRQLLLGVTCLDSVTATPVRAPGYLVGDLIAGVSVDDEGRVVTVVDLDQVAAALASGKSVA